MLFLKLPPAAALRSLVMGYWFIEDLPGAYEGQPIHTTPHPGAVLTINFGRPCTADFAAGAPRASLLGVQSRSRTWHSGPDCYFVMVMLRPTGLARLFPSSGAALGDDMLELGAFLGDGVTRRLSDALYEAWAPRDIAGRLDAWLLRRVEETRPPSEIARFSRAWDTLRHTGRVEAAAEAAGVSMRQLERWFQAHVGHGPKRLLGLDRVHASLQSAQTGQGDPLEGFSDQSHQIRSWRRHLGMTPGQYARASSSILAGYFNPRRATAEGLAHFL
ncbi:helix-turn-helix domain-containing protein [Pyxidicoccus sp. 3LG]